MAFHYTRIIGGSTGGFSFSLNKASSGGSVVSKLEVWAMENGVKAIRLSFTSGNSYTYGVPEQPSGQGALRLASFDFQTDELLTSLSLWGNGAGTRFGWIKFKTNKGRTFDHGMYKWGLKEEFVETVASGILVGVKGRANKDIDSLGLVFLQPITYMRFTNMSYTLSAPGTVSQRTLDTYAYTNTLDKDVKWVFNNDSDVDNTFKWVLTNKTGISVYHTINDGLKVVKVPTIEAKEVSGKAEFVWGLSDKNNFSSTSFSTTEKLEWYASGTVKPNGSVRATAITGRASMSTNFKASIQVDFKDTTTKLSYSFEGLFTGTTHSNAIVI
ncbi:hypothetical protein GOP47_0029196 [Adiantum capillus-veneris]|nr:hypothetical protein GOP47_0029196 [Adiantum capillus-veneris]